MHSNEKRDEMTWKELSLFSLAQVTQCVYEMAHKNIEEVSLKKV
jgi:hypothetical protein